MHFMFAARAIIGVSGGVERMITSIMNEMLDRGHKISLITWDNDPQEEPFYHLDDGISWTRLQIGDPSQKASRQQMIMRMHAIRSAVRRASPHAIIGFQDGPTMSMLAYTLGMRVPIVAAERNAPSRFTYTKSGNRRFATYAAFALCSGIIVQLESYKDSYPSFLRSKISAIPNPVLQQSIFASPAVPNADGIFTLLSVGRLSFQKNYTVLIAAFSKIAESFPKWRLKIIGEGEQRKALQSLVSESGLSPQRVQMPGAVKEIGAQYRNAHLFCLPSLWEGFPNALAEALAHGLPSIGFGECAGVNELIIDQENGCLVPGGWSADRLATSLSRLMQMRELRAEMGLHAIESVRKYEPNGIYARWERALVRATAR